MKFRLLKIQSVPVVALLAASLAVARAADSDESDKTNAPPVRKESGPAKLDESAFRIVSERNIFNANRSGGTVRSTNTRRPVRVEVFALVGTMAYEKGAFAFFEGTGSEFTKALKPDGIIAGYKLVDILANGVKLEMDGQVTELPIGSGFRREDQGAWKVTEMATTPDTSTGGVTSSNESNGAPTVTAVRGAVMIRIQSALAIAVQKAPVPPAGRAPSADQSEILKRLMERREKESQ